MVRALREECPHSFLEGIDLECETGSDSVTSDSVMALAATQIGFPSQSETKGGKTDVSEHSGLSLTLINRHLLYEKIGC